MLRSVVSFSLCVYVASGVPQDVLPGPYPRTAEERAAAAKKYNLRLEDYQPHPDDGHGLVTHTDAHHVQHVQPWGTDSRLSFKSMFLFIRL